MKLFYLYNIVSILCFVGNMYGQNNRISEYNNIGWYNLFLTTKLNKKLSFHSEVQFRRNDLISENKQKLIRIGVNFHSNPYILLRGGYAFIETFAYGNIPINSFGRSFSEHRFYQMLQLSDKEGAFSFLHRFMLEQRLIGRYYTSSSSVEDEFPLSNRIRYLFRIQTPILKNINDKSMLYLAFYDEVFLGFGENVNANVFDQNRLGALIGYKLNENTRIEIGYLNQILQFGREINNQNIFQYNNGIILNINFDIDLSD